MFMHTQTIFCSLVGSVRAALLMRLISRLYAAWSAAQTTARALWWNVTRVDAKVRGWFRLKIHGSPETFASTAPKLNLEGYSNDQQSSLSAPRTLCFRTERLRYVKTCTALGAQCAELCVPYAEQQNRVIITDQPFCSSCSSRLLNLLCNLYFSSRVWGSAFSASSWNPLSASYLMYSEWLNSSTDLTPLRSCERYRTARVYWRRDQTFLIRTRWQSHKAMLIQYVRYLGVA